MPIAKYGATAFPAVEVRKRISNVDIGRPSLPSPLSRPISFRLLPAGLLSPGTSAY
jgi:hypothetical protein